MKKILSVLFLLLAAAAWAQAAGDSQVRLTGSILLPADSGYKDIYGKSMFYPELKAGYAFFGNFYIWAGYGYLSRNGETPVLKLPAESTQNFISLGVGYGANLTGGLGFLVELGLVDVFYKENALGLEESGSVLGFRADGCLTYTLAGPFFVDLEAGYISTSKEVKGTTIKPGGFRAGLGMGVKF